jgi:hypothetical protein
MFDFHELLYPLVKRNSPLFATLDVSLFAGAQRLPHAVQHCDDFTTALCACTTEIVVVKTEVELAASEPNLDVQHDL